MYGIAGDVTANRLHNLILSGISRNLCTGTRYGAEWRPAFFFGQAFLYRLYFVQLFL